MATDSHTDKIYVVRTENHGWNRGKDLLSRRQGRGKKVCFRIRRAGLQPAVDAGQLVSGLLHDGRRPHPGERSLHPVPDLPHLGRHQ